MRKIRKGDNVIVISGRDKGRKGAVVSAPTTTPSSSRASTA